MLCLTDSSLISLGLLTILAPPGCLHRLALLGLASLNVSLLALGLIVLQTPLLLLGDLLGPLALSAVLRWHNRDISQIPMIGIPRP